ncbi:ATP-binding protein [Parvularcula lutaonensis]|uniref:histidine kinase n=1 Tax=Parvularcula lutaonensis TaxID=491923 RepID=A0ABV7M9Y2_9PROT|nr:ATP-binding protein [Parvularcula lutaonensis]GGY44650.1 two-component sensor histidine kinase [Parvularcula lutaonensis]
MLRRIAPKSLWGRTVLIVVLPIFLMQSVVTFIFFNRHWEEVTGSLARQSASEMAHILELWRDPPEGLDRDDIVEMAREDLQLFMRWAPGETIPERDKLSFFSPPNRTLEDELSRAISEPVWINTRGYADEVEVRVQLDDGYLVFVTPRDQVTAQNGHLFVLWLIATTMLLGYVAVQFMRNQVRSITRLAAAAEAFGRGDDMPEFRPTGAREVRQAGQAFMAMRARIKRYLLQRTEMLAGVSHDLRTPLTRMKLGIAMLPEGEDRDALDADAKEMERMLEAYLDFVRDSQDTDRTIVSVGELAADLKAEFARMGKALEVEIEEDLSVDASPLSLKRALSNLCSNAFAHATRVRLEGHRAGGSVILTVDDDGPGIAKEDRDRALQPFERLDSSRSSPGSGLGLSIVQDIVRNHGGRLTLGESPLGGLRATISLPG